MKKCLHARVVPDAYQNIIVRIEVVEKQQMTKDVSKEKNRKVHISLKS